MRLHHEELRLRLERSAVVPGQGSVIAVIEETRETSYDHHPPGHE